MYYGGWRNAKLKTPGSQKEPSGYLGFPLPQLFINLQSLFTHLNFSLWFRNRLLPCCKNIRMAKAGQWGGQFCRNRMDFTHMCHNLILTFSHFSASLSFDDTSYVRTSQISSNFTYISGTFITYTNTKWRPNVFLFFVFLFKVISTHQNKPN